MEPTPTPSNPEPIGTRLLDDPSVGVALRADLKAAAHEDVLSAVGLRLHCTDAQVPNFPLLFSARPSLYDGGPMPNPPDEPTPVEPALPAVDGSRRWTLFHPDADLGPRAVLGDRFEVGELLGAGGNSWVHACRDRLLKNMAAIKILKEGTADARRRFLEEGRILASLKHPHLVQVLARGETDTKAPFMVLELLPGRSLDQRLLDGPLPWREVAELIAQVAGALDCLHRAGVTHRDVKPSNIVQISGATDRPLIKLIDLGVAKVENWGRLQSGGFTPPPRHQTATGLVVGTPGFLPPEVSKAKPNARFDIFALGVTIFSLCTGEMPDLLQLRRMNEVRPECGAPPELEMLVAAALALDPDQRIASAAEIQFRLDAIRLARADETSPYLFVGCYELLEPLGVGAKGEVHRAYHMEELRYVALKLLGGRAKDNEEEAMRFACEAKALSVTRHAALPELVECRTSPKHANRYIAMTLVRGKRASEFCRQPKCLKPADVISVAQQLAGALMALHANGILHRDLHNGNVLIDIGPPITATLIDLGMCEFTDRYYAAVEQRYPTPPGHRIKLGTGGMEKFEWTAPEARATKIWTEKCDVYSLGLLLYKLLTGKHPYKGHALVSPEQYVPACPERLSSALLTALDHDPAERVDLPGLLAKLADASDELTELDEDVVADALLKTATPPPTLATQPITPPPVARSPVASTPLGPSTRRRSSAWPVLALAAGAALAFAWWGRSPPTNTDLGPGATASVPATVTQNQPDLSVTADTAQVSKPSAPSVKPVREALNGVAEQLRNCARLAGGVLILELVAEGDRLTNVTIQGAGEKHVASCVTDITTPLRFAPTPRQTLDEEYMP